MRKIDMHNHPRLKDYTCEEIIKNMDELGIDKLFLLTVDCDSLGNIGEAIFSLEACVEFKGKFPDRFEIGYCPDPRVPGAVKRLDDAVKKYGVKICGEVKFRMMYDNPDILDVFRYCGENDLPVVLHWDTASAQPMGKDCPFPHLWYGGDIYTLERTLALCPDTKFFAHGPGFWSHISNDEQAMTVAYPKGEVVRGGMVEKLVEKYTNLYLDCSAGSCCLALKRSPEYTKELMLKYSDRFAFGRDCFSNDLVEFIDTLNLPAENIEKFYHGNIEKLIKNV